MVVIIFATLLLRVVGQLEIEGGLNAVIKNGSLFKSCHRKIIINTMDYKVITTSCSAKRDLGNLAL